MALALIAIIRKSERRVLLDPAFGLGDGVTCQEGDEFRLLRTSQNGHLADYAEYVAKSLRHAGWRVKVRDCSNLAPRATLVIGGRHGPLITHREIAYASGLIAAELVNEIGDVRPEVEDPTKSYTPPPLPPPPVEPKPHTGPGYRIHREVCLTCGHATTSGIGTRSHIKNRGHSGFQTTRVEDVPALQERIRARADQQECSPELTRSASSASNQSPNGYPNPSDSEAPDALPDGSAS